jgi:ABC-2 type transport system ATP-binding protein
MSSPPVEVRSLNKQYKGGTWANRDLTLSAIRGEILGIVGPNGAGKTTLVRQVTTELLPTSGEVRVFGIDAVARPREVKGLMGVMPQEASLYWGLSTHHQLRIFGKLRGLPARLARRRREELIADLGLEEHRRKSIEALSGGLRRRVLLGIASVADPPLLILDEPSAGLDPEARHGLWELLRRYRQEGKTVLLTTHYMEEAEELCDRVAIIQDGSLLALDTVGNLHAAHGYRYKITFTTTVGTRSLHGNDDRQLVARVQAMGIDQYSLTRTTLEDVYLGLTGGGQESAAEEDGDDEHHTSD